MIKQSVSIVTLTKNRAPLLKKCLQSLVNQRTKPQEVVVVDNESTDETRQVIMEFKKTLPIQYVYTKVRGYPALYNLGIQASSGRWVALLDDDCVASYDWLTAFKKAVTKHPTAVLQGKTLSLPKGNIYAEITQDHYQNWIASNLKKLNSIQTVDNKNLCVPRSVTVQHGAFRETLTAGSEDIELGVRYRRAGVSLLYVPTALAHHHERTTFIEFVRQHVRIARSESIVARKFLNEDNLRMIPWRKSLLHLRSAFLREWQYLQNGRILDAMRLPFIYLALIYVRIYGFTARHI
jgi:GT2 family glycosyltransferase